MKRQIFNILTVWLLTGLWHGASWNFVLWGGYYAVLLIMEKLGLLKVLKRAPAAVTHIYTMFLVMLGWALFYFEDMGALGEFFVQAFGFGATAAAGVNTVLAYLPLMVVAAVAATPLGAKIYARFRNAKWMGAAEILVTAVILLLCVRALVSQSYNPFIYFRF